MKTPKDSFELLAKLLSEQRMPDSEARSRLDDLIFFVAKDIAALLEKSAYPQKALLMEGMRGVLERAEILIRFPQLVGRTIIGIMGTNGLDRPLLEFVAKSKLAALNNSLPAVLYATEDPTPIQAVNLAENQVHLHDREFVAATRELFKRGIDIRRFLYAFSIPARIPDRAACYIHFPYYALKSMKYCRQLLDMTDAMLIPTDGKEIWRQTMESFAKSHPLTPIVVVTDEEGKDAAEAAVGQYVEKARRKEQSVVVRRIGRELDEWLSTIVRRRDNVGCAESLLHLFSRLMLFQHRENSRLAQIVEGMNRDLLRIEHEDTQSSLRKLKGEMSEALSAGRELYREGYEALQELLEKVGSFERSLHTAVGIPAESGTGETMAYHAAYEEDAVRLILHFMECGERDIARAYLDKLRRMNYPYLYIFEMLNEAAAGRQPSAQHLRQLAQESDENCGLVAKAKIRFHDLLGLPAGQAAKLAEQFAELLDGMESLIAAVDWEQCGDMEAAKRYYVQALDYGEVHADRQFLLRLVHSAEPQELEKIANLLIPEANYRFGLHCLENGRYARGITALKMAAVYGHVPAIRKLADIEFSHAVKHRKVDKAQAERSMRIARELYGYLLKNQAGDSAVHENLGQIFYWLGDYRQARSLLEQGTSPQAMYYCGRMYQYGNGTAQDLEKAKAYFAKAAEMGHSQAKVEYEKVCGWIESNRSRETYSSGRDYSTVRSYGDTYRKDFCLLTTATCLALGKEDDCEEIQAFKKYRDEQLINDADGAALIREYYRIAPEIVARIEQQPEPSAIYRQLYDRYIAPGYSHLLDRNYALAKATYIAMVQYLCSQYRIEINAEVHR